MITEETRREAHEKIKPKKPVRKKIILDALDWYGENTASGLAHLLCNLGYIPHPVRNYVHPRLNELEKAGLVKVCGKKKDPSTGRTVAVYRRLK